MTYTRFRFAAIALTACLLLSKSVVADDSSGQQTDQSQNRQAKAAENWIDELSGKVQLSKDQKEQIRNKLNEHSQKVDETWQKFVDANAKAIALEATMYSAIEDQMTDEQKQQFREKRKEQAKRHNQSSAASSQSTVSTQGQSADHQDAKDKGTSEKDTSGEQSHTDEHAGSDEHASANDQTPGQSKTAGKTQSHQGQDEHEYVYVTEMIIVPASENLTEMEMDNKQRQQCDEACREFHDKLTNAWQDVHRYHRQLVQMEAEKIQAVESVLDAGQLEKLKSQRSDANDQHEERQPS